MKFGINLGEGSTLRGLVWLITAITGFVFVLQGREVSELLLLAAGVAGGVGVITKES